MKKKINYLFLLLIAIMVPSAVCISQFTDTEWAQFRGPDRDGISAEQLSESDWPGMVPELMWKQQIGSGFSMALFIPW